MSEAPSPFSSWPSVAILPYIKIPGVNNYQEFQQLKKLPQRTLDEALFSPWSTDAHFVTYLARQGDQPIAFPRLTKGFLSALQVQGVTVETGLMVFDYDNPDHAPWKSHDEVLAFRDRLLTRTPSQLAAWYSTRSGARLLYLLDRPLSVVESEAKHRGMVQRLTNAGLAVDPKASDWTRVFRLPCVSRDGVLTHEQDYFEIELFEKAGRISGSRLLATTHVLPPSVRPGMPPLPEAAKALCQVLSGGTGQFVGTKLYNMAKRQLMGRECWEVLFNEAPMPGPGQRNVTLTQYVGQVVSMLYGKEEATPDAVYGLFLPVVEGLEPDKDTPDWCRITWSMILRFWAAEERKAVEVQQKQEQVEENKELGLEQIVEKVMQWCDDAILHDPNMDVAKNWMERRLIVSIAENYLIMTPSGYYDSQQVSSTHLIPRIRELGMDTIIQTRRLCDDGTWKDRDTKALINQYVKPVAGIEGKCQAPGTVVENLGRAHSIAVVSLFARNPQLTPQFDPDVDTWLHKLFGENYGKACAWIGQALAFEDGPICALSIESDPGAGKKMLVWGLAECLQTPFLAQAEDILGSWQYGLSQSPFLLVNEGWPQERNHRPIDRFRAMVGGDPQLLSKKFQAPVLARNPARVIFTANNLSVVRGLLQGDDEMSLADRQAVGERILHFSVGNAAAIWLAEQGGLNFTGREGRRWIASDSGRTSQFIVARHFLWLWTQRPPAEGRFLVMGNAMTELLGELRNQSGSSPLVIEIILKLVEEVTTSQSKGMAIMPDGKLYLVASAIQDYYRQKMTGSSERKLPMYAINECIKALVACETPRHPWVLEGFEGLGKNRWHEIDCPNLLEVAQKNGWRCSKLERLIEKQQGVVGRMPAATGLRKEQRNGTQAMA